MATDYYTKTTRSMLGFSDEVGPKPFILFQYYKTWETAPDGIRPSLERIARDLQMFDRHGKPAKSAVSNLNKILVDKKWIIIYKSEYFLIKSFRNSEREWFIFFILRHFLSEILKAHSDILNGHSEFLNAPFRNSESSYIRNENKDLGIKIEKEKNYENFLEEVGQRPVQISSSGNGNHPSANEDSDDSSPSDSNPEKTKTEVPPSGEGTNGKPKTEVPRGGEGKSKLSKRSNQPKTRKKTDEEAITRPDIPDDADWLVWLKDHARYEGIDVLGKYRDMLDWCRKNKKTPSRLRLVNWLDQERAALPMKAVDLSAPPPNGKPIPPTGKTVEKLTDVERNEMLNWLKTKADWFYFEDEFTPEDWVWLKEKLEEKAEVAV